MNLLTLTQAREFVMQGRLDAEGVECPCCGQLAKVYTRKIHSTMARWLMRACWEFKAKPRWISVRESWSLQFNIGDVGKLAYWHLAVQKPKDPDDKSKRTSGLWKPTKKGVEFVRGNLRVENAALVYNGECIGWVEEPMVSFKDCLGELWNFDELMRESAHAAMKKAHA